MSPDKLVRIMIVKPVKLWGKPFLALACVVQVILLSLSTASPEMHDFFFYDTDKSNSEGSYCRQCCAHYENVAEPGESAKEGERTCPVSIFATGVILSPFFDLPIVQRAAAPEHIWGKPQSILEPSVKGSGKPRAPPLAC